MARSQKRNKHTLSHYKLLTGDMGLLYPCGLVEILPGDTVQHATQALIRLSPLAAPMMHSATVRIHHFFVPARLSWDEVTATVSWEDFITGGPDGNDATQMPRVVNPGTAGTITDYMGVPLKTATISSMPIRAFNLIYNEFYRDQDLAVVRELTDFTVPRIAWEKDYFTSARPWTQKGDVVTLPIGARAPVVGIGKSDQSYPNVDSPVFETGGAASIEYPSSDAVGGGFQVTEDEENLGFPGIYADLSEATGVNINEVRKAFALQRFAEARARYGSRYTEYLKYLGVRSPDSRLQRPEYLGGGRVTVSISEVLQTSPDESGPASSFVGDLYGHGIAAMRSNRYRRHFQEHGYIMSLLSVRPKAVYSDGIARHWLRRFREDHYQKELQHIGQQEVWEGEVFAEDEGTGTYNTWGYQDRYMEYREEPSKATSEFRGLLDYWHMARIFEALPALNQTFTDCDATKRIFSAQENDTLWMMVRHNMVARRLVDRNASARIY